MGNGKKNIFIGTSGWVYKEWANDFYRGLKPEEQFPCYITQFPTVEINATFYRLPPLSMVRGWRQKAPPGFGQNTPGIALSLFTNKSRLARYSAFG